MSSESILTDEARPARPPNLARNATIALAGFLSVLAAIRYGIHAETLVMISFICVLVAISRVDLERRIIPNRIVVPAWIAVLLAHLAIHPGHWLEWLVASFGAGIFFLVVALVNPGGLGMGDVKLALLLGAALGLDVVPALAIGSFAAALWGVVLLVRHGAAARKQAMPLGPFLAFGAVLMLLAG